MPIEINQLHIRVNVNGEDKPELQRTTGDIKKNREIIIAACVEAVRDILDRKEIR